MDAAVFVEHAVVFDAGDVAGLAGRAAFEELENGFGAGPGFEEIAAAPVMRDEAEDVKIGKRFAG